MRIVEIIPQLTSGGAERFTVDICNELALSNKVKLIVFFDFKEDTFLANELNPDIEVVTMHKKPGFELGLFKRLNAEITKFKPDVVHTHLGAIQYTPLAALLHPNIKFFHTVHSRADMESEGKLGGIVRKTLFKLGRTTPVTLSKESNDSFIDFYGLSAPIIENGRNVPANFKSCASVIEEINSLRKSSSTKVLINLASMYVVKRQPLIARVCKRLETDGYDFVMLFVGRIYDNSILEEVNAVECSSCHVLGEKTNPLDYLNIADAYCLMSSYEGLPVSLIEALGLGVPAVCTPVGGINNVIQSGVNGILADDISEDACYRAIKSFLDMNPTEVEQMRINARKTYQPYTMTACAQNYVRLFFRIL